MDNPTRLTHLKEHLSLSASTTSFNRETQESHQRHHLGEVIGIRPIYPVLILSQEQRQFLGEDVQHSVEGREGIFRDEDEQDALDVLNAGLIQRDVGVAHAHEESDELWRS